MTWLAALLLLSAGAAAEAGVREALPTRADAAEAFFEDEFWTCRALIDVCDTGPILLPVESIGKLRCRSAGRGRATCRFRAVSSRCTARFVSPRAAADWARALSWRERPPPARQAWLVDWATGVPRGPRIKCK